MRISDWSSDVCSSDLRLPDALGKAFIIRRLQPDIAEAKRINIFADGIETGGTQPHHLFVGKAGSQYHATHRRIIPIIPLQIVRVPAAKVSQQLPSCINQRPRPAYWRTPCKS